MKKEKSSIIVLTRSESSGDESEKAMPKIDKEELRKCLQNSDEENEKKLLPKSQKNLSRKEKLLLIIMLIKINQLNQSKKQRNPSKKTHPQNIS